MNNDLEIFYNFVCMPNKYYSCNSTFKIKDNKKVFFTKNHFIKSYNELKNWVNKNKDTNCYMNYNPLKEPINRKNENVLGFNMISLDIEFKDKQKPEFESRLILLYNIIKESLIKQNRVKRFMIVISGNGVHVYVSIGNIIKRDLYILKPQFNKFVKTLSYEINEYSKKYYGLEIVSDDRKDLAGVLRLPETINLSANRIVKIESLNEDGDNIFIRKRFFKIGKKALLQIKKVKSIHHKLNGTMKNIPQSIGELENHPLVELLFDVDLPDVDGWHSTIIFALQAVIKFSDIPHNDVLALETDINNMWDTSVSLSSCNAENSIGPIIGAINFCKKNGFDKYVEKLQKLI